MTINQAMKLRERIERDDSQCIVEDVSRNGCMVRDSRTDYTFRVTSLRDWQEHVKAADSDYRCW